MKKFPKGGLIGKAVDAYLSVREKQIPLHAASVSYTHLTLPTICSV